jgi:hypothetical protein
MHRTHPARLKHPPTFVNVSAVVFVLCYHALAHWHGTALLYGETTAGVVHPSDVEQMLIEERQVSLLSPLVRHYQPLSLAYQTLSATVLAYQI